MAWIRVSPSDPLGESYYPRVQSEYYASELVREALLRSPRTGLPRVAPAEGATRGEARGGTRGDSPGGR